MSRSCCFSNVDAVPWLSLLGDRLHHPFAFRTPTRLVLVQYVEGLEDKQPFNRAGVEAVLVLSKAIISALYFLPVVCISGWRILDKGRGTSEIEALILLVERGHPPVESDGIV